MILGLIRKFMKTGKVSTFAVALKEIDYQTLLLLAGLFLVIGGISEAGVINEISKLFLKIGGDNVFLIYTLIVWAIWS